MWLLLHPMTLTYNVDSSTAYQGISGLSSLAAGMSVNMDAEIQSDGSMLATRVYVPNPNSRRHDVYGSNAAQMLNTAPISAGGLFGSMGFSSMTTALREWIVMKRWMESRTSRTG